MMLLSGAAEAGPAPAGPRLIAASGRWAVLSGRAGCEAASLALRPVAKGETPARAAVAFDARRGGRRGQFSLRLSKVPRAGSSVMLTIGDAPFLLAPSGGWAWSRGPAQEAAILAALRFSSTMRVEARSAKGGRFVDRFDLAGAPTAIDAAAACALSLAKS